MSTDPLVGRRAELAFLHRLLADARAGSGRLVLVTGPAGIGKTRLVEELVAGAGDVAVGWGASVVDAGMPALWPWTRAVRELPASAEAIAALVAGGVRGEYVSAQEAAAATFAAHTRAVDALQEAAARDGLLVVLDDLQWADDASVRLLERLVSEIRRTSILVVATHRDPEQEALRGLLAHTATELLDLGPLSSAESVELLLDAVGPADPEAVRRAAERSGGSPLYLRTLGRVAADRLRHPNGPDGPDAPSDDLAGELRHLVGAALRAVGPAAAGAVEALSVLGAAVEPELLAALLELDSPTDAVALLRPAVPAGLVEVRSGSAYRIRFAHALVRDAAYAGLGPQRRVTLHRRAAEVLEPRAVGRDERAGAVARHWVRAQLPGRAARWAMRAADAARAAGGYREAVDYLRLVLDADDARDADPVDRAEVLLDLARVQYLGGHLRESVRSCRQAADEGERTGRGEVVARAGIVIQGVAHPEVNREVEAICRRALAMLDAHGATALRARVAAQLACTLHELGGDEEAGSWARRALADAAEAGDPSAELDAIRARATVTWQPGFADELLELGRRTIELAESPLDLLWGHLWRSDAAMHLADITGARAEIAALEVLAERSGLPLVRWHLLRRQATISALTGRFEACRRFAADAAEIAGVWGTDTLLTQFGLTATLAQLRGDPADLEPGWMRWLEHLAALPVVAQAGLASALLLAGRRDEAESLYQALLAVAPRLTGYNNAALISLIELATGLRDAQGCRILHEVLGRTLGDTLAYGAGTVLYGGAVARLYGLLELGFGEFGSAAERFAEAIRVDTLLGARPYLAHDRLGLARALLETGHPRRAGELARAAAAEARRLDMPGLLREADAFLADAASRARSADPLTAREREIAELVAQALSNRDIARRLVLSERTVESHVSRILAKTGLTTRTELTRWLLKGAR